MFSVNKKSKKEVLEESGRLVCHKFHDGMGQSYYVSWFIKKYSPRTGFSRIASAPCYSMENSHMEIWYKLKRNLWEEIKYVEDNT